MPERGLGLAPVETPVIGVVGAGQLARMMQQAAIALDVPLRLLAEAADSSAARVITDVQVGDYTDLRTLRSWAAGCSVVTFDHEHVPTGHLEALGAAGIACHPGPKALVHAQDKVVMREQLTALGVPCPRFAVVTTADDIDRFAAEVGYPVVLKTARGGYDGKGVWVLGESAEATSVLADVQGHVAAGIRILVEERVDFIRELSALAVRSQSGQVATYPVVESVQQEGICVEVVAPAPGLDPALSVEAQRLSMRVVSELEVVGVLAVELFETTDGRVLVNELAMRPHNTGHWTIDGAVTSQFENHLRAVLDLPLGATEARAPWTVMVNILGGGVPTLFDGYPHVQARDPRARVHLYGKEVKPGRKVGHVTTYGDDLDDALHRARHAAHWFQGTIDDEEGGHD
ncbi:MAG: 5-(carboxyamino)imidazole ribonucleotide synthase [Nocardioidaceae bacterium]